ncbi:MAG: endo alpha-1,4 polygalactosaminidase [Gammaproteobacteria bacterium]|jgi:uncharacterized protein (TIGR01370 family)
MEQKFYCRFFNVLLLLFLLLFSLACYANKLNSIAFYYGSNLPVDELRAFDVTVVDPEQHSISPAKFNASHSQMFAYVSVGEVNPARSYFAKISSNWIIGENPTWQAKVLDQSNPQWRDFFVKRIIKPLWDKGYRGFFLDTLDSYQLAAKTPEARAKQEEGLVKLIEAVKKEYPQAQLIFNRGFEILPKVHKLVYAVAAESLFAGWNQAERKYEPVSAEDREWLLTKLREVQGYNLPIVVIDYVAPAKRTEAREVAQKIMKLGFIPWVADADLTSLGIGSVEVMPRKILVLYDSNITKDIMQTNALMYAAMPLEYYGYVPLFHDVHKWVLPQKSLAGSYAGILLWTGTDYLSLHKQLQDWLVKQKQQNIPIVILNSLGEKLSKNFTNNFGLVIKSKAPRPASVKIIKKSPLMDYEMQSFPNPYSFVPIKSLQGTVLLQLQDNRGDLADMAAITPWGGYVIQPFVLVNLPNEQARWIVNPLQFFRLAFKLQPQPVPDVTTENGQRIMIVHVDGDGFVSRTEWNPKLLDGAGMLQEIFQHYDVPSTVSIIQSEIGKKGVYPKLSEEAEAVARKIFRLPWIEVASHSFSHPYVWQPELVKKLPKYYKTWHLPVPNYKFNLQDEITGSVKYINTELAPAGKLCKVFLWTGNCNPGAAAVALTYKDNLLNMNGGDTVITNNQKSLTNIAPLGVYKGKYFQVFAPNQNENIYTNEWRGPYYGYRRVIETFKLTDKPLRFKPIDIYYHFYSASKTASLKALKTVYDWALKQPVINLYASEYINKVLDFNHIALAKKDSGWLINSRGELRELRIPQSLGYPDLLHSTNVIGFSSYGKDYYVHLGTKQQTILRLQSQAPKISYIADANGLISDFVRSSDGFTFKLKSYTPAKLNLANMHSCKLYQNNRLIRPQETVTGMQSFVFKDKGSYAFKVRCK